MSSEEVINLSLDDDTEARLNAISHDTGRSLDDLVRSAVEDATLGYFRDRGFVGDPASQQED